MKPLPIQTPSKPMPAVGYVTFKCWTCGCGWPAFGPTDANYIVCPACGGNKITHKTHFRAMNRGSPGEPVAIND